MEVEGEEPAVRMTKTAVRKWLREQYNVPDAEIECILHQGDWRYLDALSEKYAGQAFEPGPAAVHEATEFALSALVECHGGPHLVTCPSYNERECASTVDGWYCGIDQRWHDDLVKGRHDWLAPTATAVKR